MGSDNRRVGREGEGESGGEGGSGNGRGGGGMGQEWCRHDR